MTAGARLAALAQARASAPHTMEQAMQRVTT
jgi:hypothetical protein